jgi:hypothetical protein
VRIELAGRNPLRRRELKADYHEDKGNLVLDARGLQWVSPLELAATVVMGIDGAARGREVRLLLPHDPKIASYLVRMNVVELLAPVAEVDGTIPDQDRQDHSDTLMEVTEVTPSNVEKLSGKLGTMVTDSLGRRAGKAAFRSLAELLGNATTHGQSASGAFTAAQLYTGALSRTPGFEFAVCDAGCGILDRLCDSGGQHHLDGPAALERVLDGVAGSPRGRGHGLSSLWRHAMRNGNGGELMLRSSGAIAAVKLREQPTRICSTVATTTGGTWVWLRVRVL